MSAIEFINHMFSLMNLYTNIHDCACYRKKMKLIKGIESNAPELSTCMRAPVNAIKELTVAA